MATSVAERGVVVRVLGTREIDLVGREVQRRSLLEYLSVFPGAFTLQGALALAGNLVGPDAVLDNLEQLVAKSLVTSSPRTGQARFRLLETTRAYATEKLAASGATQAAKLRHAQYVLEALTPRTYEPGGQRPGGWTHRVELFGRLDAFRNHRR